MLVGKANATCYLVLLALRTFCFAKVIYAGLDSSYKMRAVKSMLSNMDGDDSVVHHFCIALASLTGAELALPHI